MRSATAVLTVKLLGDNQTSKAFRDAQNQAQAFEQGLSRAAGVATAALGGLAVGAGLSVKAASDLGETFNAVTKTFGPAADKITEFGETAAATTGLSQRAFQELATSTGALLTNMGYDADTAADSTINLASRAADMASVFNTDVDTALEAINAGLRGESEPLRAFGVGLSAAAVESQAMAMGLWDGKGALDANAKALATEALILEQTSKYAGDFADTSDSLANSQRILAADVENLGADLGEALLPAATAAVGIFQQMVQWARDNSTTVQALAGTVAGLTAAVIGVNAAYKAYNATAAAVTAVQTVLRSEQLKNTAATIRATAATAAQKTAMLVAKGAMLAMRVATAAWTAAQWLLNAALTANPIGLVVAAIALLIGGLVLAYKKSDTFRGIVNGLGRALSTVLGAAVRGVSSAISTLVGWLQSAWSWMSNLISKAGSLLSSLNPLKSIGGLLGGLFGRSATRVAAPRTPTMTAARTTGTVINVYGSTQSSPDVRALRRLMEADDVRQRGTQGRMRPLAVAW